MAEVTSITKLPVVPSIEQKMWFYRYTKAAATDTLDCSGEFNVVRGGFASIAGTDDTISVSSNTTVTFSAGTGAGWALIIGDGS